MLQQMLIIGRFFCKIHEEEAHKAFPSFTPFDNSTFKKNKNSRNLYLTNNQHCLK